MSLRPAVFLDRDGVINRNVLDPATGRYGAPLRPEDFEPVRGGIAALADLRRAGFLLFLISNQPNFAKGKSTLEDLAAIHQRLASDLETGEVSFAEFYYCYHHPQGIVAGYSGPCDCRKPSPYFLFAARDAFGVSLEDSWMVGDRATDIECGRAAGVRTIRLLEDHPAQRDADELRADFEASDLVGAVAIILHSAAKANP